MYGRTTDDSFQSMLMVWFGWKTIPISIATKESHNKKKRPLSRQAEDSMDPNQFQPGNPSCNTAVRSPQSALPRAFHPSVHPADLKTAYTAKKKKNTALKEPEKTWPIELQNRHGPHVAPCYASLQILPRKRGSKPKQPTPKSQAR
jgi:hypothetical protein